MRERLLPTTPNRYSVSPRRGWRDVLFRWKRDLFSHTEVRDEPSHLCGMPGRAEYCRSVFAVDCNYDTAMDVEGFIRDVTSEFGNVLGTATARKLEKGLSYAGRIVPRGDRGCRIYAIVRFALPLPGEVQSLGSLIPLHTARRVSFMHPGCASVREDGERRFVWNQTAARDAMAEPGVGVNFDRSPWEMYRED